MRVTAALTIAGLSLASCVNDDRTADPTAASDGTTSPGPSSTNDQPNLDAARTLLQQLGDDVDRIGQEYEQVSTPLFRTLDESWTALHNAADVNDCDVIPSEVARYRAAADELLELTHGAVDETEEVAALLSELETPLPRDVNALRIDVQSGLVALEAELSAPLAEDAFSTDEFYGLCLDEPPVEETAVLHPFGATPRIVVLMADVLDDSTEPDPDDPDLATLRYRLQLRFTSDTVRTIVPPVATSDQQIGIEITCPTDRSDCLSVDHDGQRVHTELIVTATYSPETLTVGEHAATVLVQLDDGTTTTFDIEFLAQPPPGPVDLGDETGPPRRVQTVFDVGRFGYHIVAGFDSIWVAGAASGTVARIDAATGELLAVIEAGTPTGRFGPTRLAIGDDAVFASGSPSYRIDPETNTAEPIDAGTIRPTAVATLGDTVWAAGDDEIHRIDPDGTTTPITAEDRNWFDLAIADGLIWVISQHMGGGELIALDPESNQIVHNLPIELADREILVRIVADDTQIVLGTDTTGGGGRAGRLITIDPTTLQTTGSVALDSRPEGIALTPQHIWTSAAVVERATLVVLEEQGLGFSITQGPDGSIWSTSVRPGTFMNDGTAVRWSPGQYVN